MQRIMLRRKKKRIIVKLKRRRRKSRIPQNPDKANLPERRRLQKPQADPKMHRRKRAFTSPGIALPQNVQIIQMSSMDVILMAKSLPLNRSRERSAA